MCQKLSSRDKKYYNFRYVIQTLSMDLDQIRIALSFDFPNE